MRQLISPLVMGARVSSGGWDSLQNHIVYPAPKMSPFNGMFCFVDIVCGFVAISNTFHITHITSPFLIYSKFGTQVFTHATWRMFRFPQIWSLQSLTSQNNTFVLFAHQPSVVLSPQQVATELFAFHRQGEATTLYILCAVFFIPHVCLHLLCKTCLLSTRVRNHSRVNAVLSASLKSIERLCQGP